MKTINVSTGICNFSASTENGLGWYILCIRYVKQPYFFLLLLLLKSILTIEVRASIRQILMTKYV